MRNDIREARKRKGFTQALLAEAIGKDQATVARYEAGKTDIGKDVAPALASVLGLSLLDVLYPPAPKSSKTKRKAA